MTNYCCNLYHDAYENSLSVSWETIIAVMGLMIAIAALLISVRLQILTFIESQLVEIAKTCNSYLQHDFQVHNEKGIIERGRASGIVTALEDAEKIINSYNKNWNVIFGFNLNHFKNVFFNHLHSSIKEVLKDVRKNAESPGFTYWKEGQIQPGKKEKYDPIRKDQLDKACDFFKTQIDEIIRLGKEREERLHITQ